MTIPPQLRVRIGLVALGILFLCSVFGFKYAENLPFADALYFSVVTVTTVGYGDIHPTTGAGKILATILILSGVCTFTIVLTSMTERLLNAREKRERLQRLNMVIGSFFSEVGTKLLFQISNLDTNLPTVQSRLANCGKWQTKDFSGVRQHMLNYPFEAQHAEKDLEELKQLLQTHTPFLMRILQNPNMAEHEQFTDLMWATFHLKEELFNRSTLTNLPKTDIKHLSGDIHRVYKLLLSQWIDYMQHLQTDYPYLFSLAVRTNPFDNTSSTIVR